MGAIALRSPEHAEPWELHSELVLVCPALRRRSLELLPERDPEAFLVRAGVSVGDDVAPVEEDGSEAVRASSVAAYAAWRAAQATRGGFFLVGSIAALAALAELLR
jgi:hypothetical protein